MNRSIRFHRLVAFSATALFLIASSLLAGDGDPTLNDPGWWAWLLGRIGVPGG